ncbi:uncharacterized protein LOC100372678 [Saccoglossus kowalevskii]
MAHKRLTAEHESNATNTADDEHREVSSALPAKKREHKPIRTKFGSTGSPKDVQFTDPVVGIIMALSLPAALLIFWYFTLPCMWWVFKSIVGAEFIRNMAYLKEDITSALTSPCAMWIPADERDYLLNHSDEQIKRLSNISKEEFAEYVKRGEPIIVTDALRDWEAYGKFNCTYLIKKYPDVEYFDWQGGRRLPLRYITERWDESEWQCISGYIDMSLEVNEKYIHDWVQQMPPPYFLSHDIYTDGGLALKKVALTGFLGTPGTGVSPHLDETCDTFMTVQLSGVKNWSVSWPVKVGDELKWDKPRLVTLYPGEAMFWYVSMRHHTEVVDGCSLSFSYQFNTPPTLYFKNLLETLNSVPRKERDRLYASTHASRLDFVDVCSIVTNNGNEYIV